MFLHKRPQERLSLPLSSLVAQSMLQDVGADSSELALRPRIAANALNLVGISPRAKALFPLFPMFDSTFRVQGLRFQLPISDRYA